jgi:hypothetical protein
MVLPCAKNPASWDGAHFAFYIRRLFIPVILRCERKRASKETSPTPRRVSFEARKSAHLRMTLIAAAPLSQSADRRPIRTYQRLFFVFGAPSSLDLPFNGNPVRDPLETFGPDQNNRTPREGVTRICSGIVLVDAWRAILTGRAANII